MKKLEGEEKIVKIIALKLEHIIKKGTEYSYEQQNMYERGIRVGLRAAGYSEEKIDEYLELAGTVLNQHFETGEEIFKCFPGWQREGYLLPIE